MKTLHLLDGAFPPLAENDVGILHRVFHYSSAALVFVLSFSAVSDPPLLGFTTLPFIGFLISIFLGPIIAAALPALAFLLWCKPLFEEEPVVPKRSLFMLLGLSIVSIGYFISGWDYGSRYQGQEYVETMAWVNGGIVAILFVIALLTRLRGSLVLNMAFHLLMFSWVGFGFLPYLGELL